MTEETTYTQGKVQARALSNEEILDMIYAFWETTRRAIEAGFDGVEIHGAYGFLIQNLTSYLHFLINGQTNGEDESAFFYRSTSKIVSTHNFA